MGATPAVHGADAASLSASAVTPFRPAWYPQKPDNYRDYKVGFINGVQYWVNADSTTQSIEADFQKMAEEDHINGARLAFWTIRLDLLPFDFTKFDACFDAAERFKIKLNTVLPQIPGWIDGRADDPLTRADYKNKIQAIVKRYKDKPALAMWTVDIEPSRSWKTDPSTFTLALYRKWLRSRYSTADEFLRMNPGAEGSLKSIMESIDRAYPINAREKGGWNNFQGMNDWITFTAWALAEQTLFVSQAVKEADPVHPTSCTPPDVLHNQVIENGRNMWWLADTVDYPSQQMHAHWHLEMADMPRDVLSAQSASIRKVYNSARGRPASYSGEVLGGPDLGESTRLYAPVAGEFLATALCHLAEGSKGYFYWLWNPLKDGPNAGAWSVRELDGSTSEKSRLLARLGRMVAKNNDLFYRMSPADTPAAIFDSMDAAIYLYRRSSYHPMSEWYAKNQYGFYKALRKTQIGCDFIDEVGLKDGTAKRYACIYVPFSMCMTADIADALRNYVEQGGTIVADAMTAFTSPGHQPYGNQPGLGLDKVLGIKALGFEVAYSGWTEVIKMDREQYFDRFLTAEEKIPHLVVSDKRGTPTALAAMKIIQPVEPAGADILGRDASGRPVMTVNHFGKGHAIWTGTLLGMTCRAADTPFARYEAVANLLKPYMPPTSWKLKAPPNTIICRRLSDGGDEIFVLINEGGKAAAFTLDFGRDANAAELLWPEKSAWRRISARAIGGKLNPLEGAVISCPKISSVK
ncbi:MAG: beta-galactosidase trimerization domain-containing protein [bacterium]